MKKTLIALAVLAASGAAFAQSSVSLYGIADIALVKAKGSSAQLASGGVSTSRLGFKGTEDLGGGLKANFLFEEGIDLTTGALKGNGFARQAYVGLAGGFGEVKLGNVYTAYDDISGATNPVFDSVLAPTVVWASTGYISNPGSNIYYASPSFGGVSGAVSYALDGSKQKVTSVNVKYEGGPVYVGFGYQDEADRTGNKFTRLNGSYDLGVVKLLAGYGQVKPEVGSKTTEYSFGADVPLGSALTLSTGLASSKVDGGDNRNSVGLGVAYSMSKRTTLYTGFRKENKAAGDTSLFAAGVKHTF
ncbi:porin [Hydrogenophaga taeniospiralis CCUG 15921]|jgi:predicted porin|uniref:Porin n=1 Tax=Hydrogenophaga taeniospiralis CCUG 15921 TaxID=1281780 RepID=A0A9X4NUV3_9BURK|nr:porin [Hydrogenophaga taeniospiralis]MDG5974790.1 porin [Hydrogenophaga taeniospiralis CCUG 15921]